jgi:EAL and modified HD-GYP domain-containing signal transduction protein
MEILVARQPIFDRREELYGYDLVLGRPTGSSAGAALPEQLVADALLGIGINQVAEGRRAFLGVDRDMLVAGAVRLLPADRVVLQIDSAIHADAELLEACSQLVWSGYRFSLTSQDYATIPDELLRLAEIVKVDIASTASETLSDLSAWLRTYHVRLLAVGVRNRSERDACTDVGFELFEGYRFTAPETVTRRDLPVAQVHTFRLLKLVRDPSTSDAELEEVLRRDVALSYKLLRMANSTAVGGRDIWSIGHALRLLGRDQIARWLGLLLITDGAKSGVRAELMNLSIVRARFCELLAEASGIPRARGPLFLVGMLSTLDELLETSMESLAQSMELAPDVREALLHRGDFYGATLALVEAYEQGDWYRVEPLSMEVGVSPDCLSTLYVEALGWAAEHQRSASGVVSARAVSGR